MMGLGLYGQAPGVPEGGGRGAARAERVQEVTERAGILRRPYASHKPYNMGRVAVFIDLNR